MKTFSKYLYVITFITFFFPFCNLSCKKEAPAESTATDSVAVEQPVEETTADTSVSLDSSSIKASDTISASNQNNEARIQTDSSRKNVIEKDTMALGDKIAEKILLPDGKNASLWGLFYFYLKPVAVAFFFVLVVLSAIYRFWNKDELLVLVYLGISLICLGSANWLRNNDSLVWGYWVMLGITAGNFLVSLVSYLSQRKNEKE
ncbi:MAG: hypothetical protein K2Q22_06625 [Cytophagales bacterium]|nr:hypothetical protein [Cytophagales bacterium]